MSEKHFPYAEIAIVLSVISLLIQVLKTILAK